MNKCEDCCYLNDGEITDQYNKVHTTKICMVNPPIWVDAWTFPEIEKPSIQFCGKFEQKSEIT